MSRTGYRGPSWETRVCGRCGDSFEVRTSDSREGRGKFCSRSCASSGRDVYWTPNWKGGRRLRSDGRYEIWMRDTDDFYEMRGKLGYCLEHRLVMARHLNRPLRSDEHVHHINGNPGDNRIENLQLRAKAHGQGVSYRCMDCGSYRVEATEL